ncbi:MAG: PIN domain-containing protein [Nocardioidaceae bacterium]
MIVVDTGPLVAAAVADDAENYRCTEFFTSVHLARQQIYVPGTVLAEAGYLIESKVSPEAEAGFLDGLATNDDVEIVETTKDDLARMAELVRQYADLPLGTTDASVIAIAEQLDITEIATLDRRHFSVVRPRHSNVLTLLPD